MSNPPQIFNTKYLNKVMAGWMSMHSTQFFKQNSQNEVQSSRQLRILKFYNIQPLLFIILRKILRLQQKQQPKKHFKGVIDPKQAILFKNQPVMQKKLVVFRLTCRKANYDQPKHPSFRQLYSSMFLPFFISIISIQLLQFAIILKYFKRKINQSSTYKTLKPEPNFIASNALLHPFQFYCCIYQLYLIQMFPHHHRHHHHNNMGTGMQIQGQMDMNMGRQQAQFGAMEYNQGRMEQNIGWQQEQRGMMEMANGNFGQGMRDMMIGQQEINMGRREMNMGVNNMNMGNYEMQKGANEFNTGTQINNMGYGMGFNGNMGYNPNMGGNMGYGMGGGMGGNMGYRPF